MTDMKSWIDTVAGDDNIWLVLVFHGVDGIGWEAKPSSEIREYLEYIKAKKEEQKLWVATFQDVTKYMRQRMHSQVTASAQGDSIAVTLSHSLDHELYGLPLTLSTEVPGNWKSVTVRQGGRVQRVAAESRNGARYVVYEALPNADAITLVDDGS
jgi:hypothetical protein